MDLLVQVVTYVGKAAPGTSLPILVMMVGYLIKQVGVLGANHLQHATESLSRIETLLRSMNDNIIYIKAKVEGESKSD